MYVRPMKLAGILSPDLVVPDIVGATSDAVLKALVHRIFEVTQDIDPEQALKVLFDRERIASTGVGSGIAIPHAKLPKLAKAVACFGRSVEGIDFAAVDGNPVHLFFVVLVPEGQTAVHLKVLARASRLFKDRSFRSRLLSLSDRESLWTAFCEEDAKLQAASGAP